MRIKIGSKLHQLREERKLTQTEMSEILGMSSSAYARLERGETQADLEQLLRFSEALQIPVQELLPETLAIHNKNNGQVGINMGTIYYGVDERMQTLEKENAVLKERILGLESTILTLRELLSKG